MAQGIHKNALCFVFGAVAVFKKIILGAYNFADMTETNKAAASVVCAGGMIGERIFGFI
jgi:hypothetical protein